MKTPRAVLAEPPVPLPLPHGPYELRVAGLRTRWPDGEVVALDDADLVLPPGRRLALVGHRPRAASALAAVLLRFLDYEGSVTLNGVELRDLAGDDVRGVVGLCAHDTRVRAASVADNVREARTDAGDEEVAAAIRRAGLVPEAAVREHDGAGRRRVALARALLADVPILVVDQPADASDDDLAAVLAAAEDRSLLLVTRRPAVPGAAPILRAVDEVIVLSGS